MNQFQDSLIIEDKQNDYKKQTFSGYKKTQVMSKLKQCILKQEIDRACFWGAEWIYQVILFMGRTDYICYNKINIINRLPIYLLKSIKNFANF